MKKKILGIIAGSLGAILVSAAIAAGILLLIRNKNVEETGNVLGVAWYNEYDEEFTIDSVEELYEFARLSDFYDFKGQTVKLGADIVINEGNAADWADKAPKTKWTPISNFAGTFDGEGHTISGLYGKAFETPMALFVKTNGKAVIKDMKLLNSYFDITGTAGVGSFGTGGDGKFEKLYSEAIIDCNGEISGGILGTVKSKATINECWFNGTINQSGRKMGGIVGVFLGGRSTMNNCLFSGKMTTTQGFFSWDTVDGALVGGITGLVNTDAGLVMKDCMAAGEISADHKTFTGAVIGRAMSGSQVNITNIYNAVTFEEREDINIGSIQGTQVGNPVKLSKELVKGINAYKWTMLDYDLYWSAIEGSTPELKYFSNNALSTEGVEKNYDTSWYNAELYEFTLYDLKDLYGFALLAKQETFDGCTIKLGADITINEGKATDWEQGKNMPTNPWFMIGDSTIAFNGTFDGQGHTISGLYVKSTQARYIGMFGRVDKSGILKNFRLVNTFIDASGDPEIRQIGGVVGCTHGDLDTIYTDAIVKSDGYDVGGLAGYVSIATPGGKNPTTVNNCWGNAKVYGKTLRRAGAFIGNATYETVVKELEDRKVELTNCLNTGYISNTRKNSTDDGLGGQIIGGMVGYIWGGFIMDAKDCVQAGTIDLTYKTYTGSFYGYNTNASGRVSFENCFSTKDSFEQNGVSRAYDGIPNKVRVGDVMVVDRERISGLKAYQHTMLDFDKYWGAVKNDVPVLKSFAGSTLSTKNVKKLIDTSWYSEDAKTLVLKDAADFYGFTYLGLAKTFEGQTIQLAKDINVNPGWKADGSVPQIICYALKNFAGTFDGKGHTLQGVYIQGGSSDNVALFGNLEEKGVVKNLVLDNSYIESKGDKGLNIGWYTGAIAGLSYGTIDGVYIKDGVTIKSNMPYCGGIAGNWRGPGAIKNCWFDGTVEHSDQTYKGNTGGIVGGVSSGGKDTNRTMENCLVTGKVVGDSWSIGGLLGGNIKGGADEKWVQTVTIKDSVFAGEVVSEKFNTWCDTIIGGIEYAYTVINLENVYETGNITAPGGAKPGTNYPGIGTIQSAAAKTTKVNGSSAEVAEEMLIGRRAYTATELDFWSKVNANGAWAATNEGTQLKQFSTASMIADDFTGFVRANTDWYTSKKVNGKIPANTTFELKNLADYLGFVKLFNGGEEDFEGHTVKLLASIDLNPGWDATKGEAPTAESAIMSTPLGNVKAPFKGTFDGGKNTIKGAYIVGGTNDGIALFGTLAESGTIKNLILENSYIESVGNKDENTGWYTGAIVGMAYGNIDSIYVKEDVVVKANMPYCGGIAGNWRGPGAIKNCWFAGTVKHSDQNYRGCTGGIVGGLSNGGKNTERTMSNCLVTGTVIADSWDIGGIIGGNLPAGTDETYTTVVHMDNCVFNGEVNSEKFNTYCNTVIGGLENAYTTVYFENVYTTDNIVVPDGSVVKPDNTYPGLGNVKKAVINGTTSSVSVAMLTGKRAYISTLLDFWSADNKDGVWAATDEGVELKKFSTSSTIADNFDGYVRASEEWYTSKMVDGKIPANTTFELKTIADYLGFVNIANSGEEDFEGHTVKLLTEIDLNPGWDASTGIAPNEDTSIITTTIGINEPFKGTFDGGMHTIKGVYIKRTGDYTGLFARVADGKIQNLILENSYIDGDWFTGAVAGHMSGTATMDTVKVGEDVYVTSDFMSLGGMIGAFKSTGQVKNCWFAGKVTSQVQVCGGLIGRLDLAPTDKPVLQNCLFTGEITAWDNIVGAMIGGTANATVKATVSDCFAGGTINARYGSALGSVIGGGSGTVTATRTYNSVNFTAMSEDGTISGTRTESNTAVGTSTRKTAEITGTAVYTNTDLDLYWKGQNDDGVWVATDNGPELEVFSKADPIYDDFTGVLKASTAWYDKDPTAETFEIATKEDLMGFNYLANNGTSFQGKTVKLMADITLNAGKASEWLAKTKTPEIYWTPLFQQAGNSLIAWENASLTFDGNGKTISGMCVDTADINGVGFFGYLDDNSMVKDLTIVNSCIASRGADDDPHSGQDAGAVAGRTRGKIQNVYVGSDVIVYQESKYAGGIVGAMRGNAQVTNSWFAGTVDMTKSNNGWGGTGGIVGGVETTDGLIENCLVTGIVKEGLYVAGGILGTVRDTDQNNTEPKEKLTVKNTVFNGELVLTNANWAGLVIGSMESQNGTFVAENVYAVGNSNKAITSGSGNTCIGKIAGSGNSWSGTATEVTAEQLQYTNALTNTSLNFYSEDNKDGVWVATYNGPELKKYSDPMNVPDTKWYTEDPSADTFYIGNKAELLGFNMLANGGTSFNGKTIVLTNDIALNEGKVQDYRSGTDVPQMRWTPLFQASGTTLIPDENSNMTFDGNGHTISGIYVYSVDVANVGFFGYLNNEGTVKNLKLENSYFNSVHQDNSPDSGSNIGAIVGNLRGKVDNTRVTADVFLETSNCYIGGVVGWMQGKASVTKSSFAGTVDMSPSGFGRGGAGGIVGRVSTTDGLIENCLVTGTVIEGTYSAAGIAGVIYADSNCSVTIRKTLFAGTLKDDKGDKWSGLITTGIDSGSNNTIVLENVYAVDNVYKKSDNSKVTLPGDHELVGVLATNRGNSLSATSVERFEDFSAVHGDAAKTKLEGFDFYSEDNTDGVWVAKADAKPELKALVTVTATQSKVKGLLALLASIF